MNCPAVIYNDYKNGGVSNTQIPTFIYRWDPRTIYQTVAACLPEREFGLYLRRYWNFNITAEELERRRETRIGVITQVAGPPLFIALLHGLQAVTNSLPWIAGQGNKTFACITKQHAVKPWIVDRDGVRIQSQIRKELTFFPIECVGFDREILRLCASTSRRKCLAVKPMRQSRAASSAKCCSPASCSWKHRSSKRG